MNRGRFALWFAAAMGLMFVAAPAITAGGSAMMIGAAEDAGKQADSSTAKAKMDLAKAAGFGAVRVTAVWNKGQTALSSSDTTALQNAATAANLDGLRLIVAIFNNKSSNTPLTDTDRAQFVQFAQAVVRSVPSATDFVIGNEPNNNLFWLPQYNPDGSDAAAPAYEALLAQSYDAIKAIRSGARIMGGTLAPRGSDSPTASKPTHSPTSFIKDLGAAYRASGRARPIMDVFDLHPYEDSSSIPPSFDHPNSTTISVPDYGKLVSLLGQAFDGTGQAGSTLPIVYLEFGVESQIPPAKASLYTGTEPTTTRPVDEATQGKYYVQALKLAYCQPNVIGLMLFHVSDEPSLAGWQSGVDYADDTPKSSLPTVHDGIGATHAGTLTTCPDSSPPTVNLTAPANGATVHGTVTLSATAADNVGVNRVEFLVNGSVVGYVAIPPYNFNWASGASGAYTITARALDGVRNSATSSVALTVDNTPPDTTITSSPPNPSSSSDASFSFTSSEGGSTFGCSLDGGTFATCASPKPYTGLAGGSHTFQVRATDAVGNTDPSPATDTWTVLDTTPPETTITAGPSGTTPQHSATFSFSASEPATFQCSLDSATWSSCTSPASYASLGNGTHSFQVRAIDTAGNVDPTPASRTWTIVTAPPNDMFANAQAILGSAGNTTGTTVNATKEPGEPNHAGNSGGHSVWYRWTAPVTGYVTISTAGSAFNTLLGVYRGSSVSSLTTVASNDDAGSGIVTSLVRFQAQGGVTYMIAVDGRNGASGAVKLSW